MFRKFFVNDCWLRVKIKTCVMCVECLDTIPIFVVGERPKKSLTHASDKGGKSCQILLQDKETAVMFS